MNDVRTLVDSFVRHLSTIVEQQAVERARASLESAFGSSSGRNAVLRLTGRRRRKGPRQLCPVPGCKNPAAPVFGMVCRDHRAVPKPKIAKYREARRAKKLKAA